MFVEDVLLSTTSVGKINRCFQDSGRCFGVALLYFIVTLCLQMVARKGRKLGKERHYVLEFDCQLSQTTFLVFFVNHG